MRRRYVRAVRCADQCLPSALFLATNWPARTALGCRRRL